ncbi:hypothetical protein NGRA_2880 [Nosema granulosis]|uniref:Uncharacterized protein n=1 Tax=Nosema granulosis TaxID=83296 RepID=A0A9P6GYH4_9MICR|nr:hypothetical protein NGRA_2880 [Nosema granulosis]
MLRDATILSKRECINMKTLLKVTISKSPAEIKSLLYQYACSVENWNMFIKQAEGASWLPFPERDVCRVDTGNNAKEISKNKVYQNKTFSNQYVCIIHGKGNHTTEKCFTIQKLEKNGWKKTKTINEIKDETSSEQYEFNKFSNIYSCDTSKKYSNPFFCGDTNKWN